MLPVHETYSVDHQTSRALFLPKMVSGHYPLPETCQKSYRAPIMIGETTASCHPFPSSFCHPSYCPSPHRRCPLPSPAIFTLLPLRTITIVSSTHDYPWNRGVLGRKSMVMLVAVMEASIAPVIVVVHERGFRRGFLVHDWVVVAMLRAI